MKTEQNIIKTWRTSCHEYMVILGELKIHTLYQLVVEIQVITLVRNSCPKKVTRIQLITSYHTHSSPHNHLPINAPQINKIRVF